PTINCSKFDEREFHIHYDKLQAVNSSASFSCKDKNKKVVGSNVLTCKPNGKWSGNPPRCQMTCPHLNASEGMYISYTDKLNEGSIAVFVCLPPKVRTGVSHKTCRKGEWVDPVPTCASTCPHLNVSEGMYISYTDNLKEGSIAVFVCLPPRVRTGVSHTTCRKGEWVDPVLTCAYETVHGRENASNSNISSAPLPDTQANLPTKDSTNCYCTYNSLDYNLMAFVGQERLKYRSRVSKNAKVQFYCVLLGFSRLNGSSEITCQNCQAWDTSTFPTCVNAVQGDTVLEFRGHWNLLPKNYVGVEKGQWLNVKCISNGIARHPLWLVQNSSLVSTESNY
ncbi:sushi, von Willebrand factor type A, EGF and pentraxin domain-containing protein 1, partial [Caerostris darwini]